MLRQLPNGETIDPRAITGVRALPGDTNDTTGTFHGPRVVIHREQGGPVVVRCDTFEDAGRLRDQVNGWVAAGPPDGGPAFPGLRIDGLASVFGGGAGVRQDGDGMSLRDYLAAHAPRDLPGQFERIAGDPPGPKPAEPTLPEDLSADAAAAIRTAIQHGLERDDLPEAFRHLWPHVEAGQAYGEAIREWYDRRDLWKFAAPRYVYADAMIAARAGIAIRGTPAPDLTPAGDDPDPGLAESLRDLINVIEPQGPPFGRDEWTDAITKARAALAAHDRKGTR